MGKKNEYIGKILIGLGFVLIGVPLLVGIIYSLLLLFRSSLYGSREYIYLLINNIIISIEGGGNYVNSIKSHDIFFRWIH